MAKLTCDQVKDILKLEAKKSRVLHAAKAAGIPAEDVAAVVGEIEYEIAKIRAFAEAQASLPGGVVAESRKKSA